jgi:hypothetical protein
LHAALHAADRRSDGLLDLLRTELIPRCNTDLLTALFLAAGDIGVRAACGNTDGQELCSFPFEAVALLEPQGAPKYDCSLLAGTNVKIYETSNLMELKLAHQESIVLVPHVALVGGAVGQGQTVPELLQHVLECVVAPGGVALLGTLAPSGPFHEFLAALEQYYTGSAAQMKHVLQVIPEIEVTTLQRTLHLECASIDELQQFIAALSQATLPENVSNQVNGVEAAAFVTRSLKGKVGMQEHGVSGLLRMIPLEMEYFIVERAVSGTQKFGDNCPA